MKSVEQTTAHRRDGPSVNDEDVGIRYSAHSYAESVRLWMLQHQWATQMSWYINVTMPVMAMNCAALNAAAAAQYNIQQVTAATGARVQASQFHNTATDSRQSRFNQAQQRLQQTQREQNPFAHEWTIPPVWRRVVAEFIDFMLLFVTRLGLSMITLEFTDAIDIDTPELENILLNEWDSNSAFAITMELFMLEILNRIVVCVFETLCLWRGLRGATPGKRMMCLQVVSCREVYGAAGDRVNIIPAGNLSFWNALLRSVVKNFSLAILFPLCFTVFLSPHKRASYDILAGSIVVEDEARPWPRPR